jgi:copper chaperone
MEEKKIQIPAISCHHCKMTIERELRELKGIRQVQVNEEDKSLSVSWEEPLSWQKIRETLVEIGYPPSE